MKTIFGILICRKSTRSHRSKNIFTSLMLDIVAPMPSNEIWFIRGESEKPKFGNLFLYQLRSRGLPKCLTRDMENKRVTLKAKVIPWGNGIGADISQCSLIKVEEP